MWCITGSRGRKVPRVSKDLKDCKALPVLRVLQAQRVLLALQVLPAPMARTAFLLQ